MLPTPTHDGITREKLSRAFNGCICICHRMSGCIHFMPCCHPTEKDIEDMKLEKIQNASRGTT